MRLSQALALHHFREVGCGTRGRGSLWSAGAFGPKRADRSMLCSCRRLIDVVTPRWAISDCVRNACLLPWWSDARDDKKRQFEGGVIWEGYRQEQSGNNVCVCSYSVLKSHCLCHGVWIPCLLFSVAWCWVRSALCACSWWRRLVKCAGCIWSTCDLECGLCSACTHAHGGRGDMEVFSFSFVETCCARWVVFSDVWRATQSR